MYCILLKETMHHLTTKEIFIQCSPKFIFSSDQPSRIICILEDIIFLKGLCFQITGNHNCFFSLQIHSTDSGIFGPNNVKLGKKTTMMNAYECLCLRDCSQDLETWEKLQFTLVTMRFKEHIIIQNINLSHIQNINLSHRNIFEVLSSFMQTLTMSSQTLFL